MATINPNNPPALTVGGQAVGTVVQWEVGGRPPDELPEEAAFWKTIGANPADSLPRLVFADWLDERAVSDSECGGCDGSGLIGEDGKGATEGVVCECCLGFGGFVGNGRAELAAALRATADRVPLERSLSRYGWSELPTDSPYFLFPWHLHPAVYTRLAAKARIRRFATYPTAEAAIRDLCRAWVAVNRKGVPA